MIFVTPKYVSKINNQSKLARIAKKIKRSDTFNKIGVLVIQKLTEPILLNDVASNAKYSEIRINACEKIGHDFSGCSCKRCALIKHDWEDCNQCKCKSCNKENHRWDRGECIKCGVKCNHDWIGCKCKKCGLENHDWIDGPPSQQPIGHNWGPEYMVCSKCGEHG